MFYDLLQDAFFSAIAAIGFSAISCPPQRAFLPTALIAAAGHSVRFLLMKPDFLAFHIVTATAIAAMVIGILAVFTSRFTKVPAETYIFPAMLPMIPGIYAYKTVGALVMCLCHGSETVFLHYFYLFSTNGLTCFAVLLAMVSGATIPIFALKRVAFQATRNSNHNN